MKLRRTTFLLSVLLHLIAIYWIIRVQVPMLIYPQKEKVIAIVPVSFPPRAEMSPIPGKNTGFAAGSGSGTGSGSAAAADTTGEIIHSETPAQAPKLIAPPLDVKEIPELSIYSENIRDIIRNFDENRTKTNSRGTAPGPGKSSTGDSSGPGGQSRAFFNIENYDLSPWAKRVLLRIQKNWLIPLAFKDIVAQPVEIIIVIEKNGKISSINVKQSSNSNAFDQAAINALRLSAPLPDLPRDFPGNNLEARFMFTSIRQ